MTLKNRAQLIVASAALAAFSIVPELIASQAQAQARALQATPAGTPENTETGPQGDAGDIVLGADDLNAYAQQLGASLMIVGSSPDAGERDKTITGTEPPLGSFIPFLGPEVEKLFIVEDGVKVEKFWQSLTPAQWRNALSSQHTETIVYKADSSGGFSYLPFASADFGKGTYRLNYDNFRYKDYPCAEADKGAGSLYVGVGLRLRATVYSKRGGFNVGFAQFALAASQSKVSGQMVADIVGLANSKTLSQVVASASGEISYESLVDASNAYAVAAQAVENMVELSNPRIIGYKDQRAPGSCLAAMQAAQ